MFTGLGAIKQTKSIFWHQMSSFHRRGGYMATENVGILGTMKKESSDILMVVAFIGILMAMILPLHPIILDFFLALNIDGPVKSRP
jgi:hypothetical protein